MKHLIFIALLVAAKALCPAPWHIAAWGLIAVGYAATFSLKAFFTTLALVLALGAVLVMGHHITLPTF